MTADDTLDAVPWEYAHGPDGFLVLESHFVRGLPAGQRTPPPTLDSGLHIIAVPSSPLDKGTPALNIDGEWMRLKEIVRQVPYAVTLERTRPPTIELNDYPDFTHLTEKLILRTIKAMQRTNVR